MRKYWWGDGSHVFHRLGSDLVKCSFICFNIYSEKFIRIIIQLWKLCKCWCTKQLNIPTPQMLWSEMHTPQLHQVYIFIYIREYGQQFIIQTRFIKRKMTVEEAYLRATFSTSWNFNFVPLLFHFFPLMKRVWIINCCPHSRIYVHINYTT